MEISYFKRDHEKGSLIFSLHPVPFYKQDYEKQIQSYELVTSLFELQDMFTKIDFLFWPLESWNWQEKEKNIEYLKNEKCFLEEIKTFSHNFWNAFFSKNIKNRRDKLKTWIFRFILMLILFKWGRSESFSNRMREGRGELKSFENREYT